MIYWYVVVAVVVCLCRMTSVPRPESSVVVLCSAAVLAAHVFLVAPHCPLDPFIAEAKKRAGPQSCATVCLGGTSAQQWGRAANGKGEEGNQLKRCLHHNSSNVKTPTTHRASTIYHSTYKDNTHNKSHPLLIPCRTSIRISSIRSS